MLCLFGELGLLGVLHFLVYLVIVLIVGYPYTSKVAHEFSITNVAHYGGYGILTMEWCNTQCHDLSSMCLSHEQWHMCYGKMYM